MGYFLSSDYGSTFGLVCPGLSVARGWGVQGGGCGGGGRLQRLEVNASFLLTQHSFSRLDG